MSILTKREVWRRPEPAHPKRSTSLTYAERVNTAAALRFLRLRFGTWQALAEALGVKHETAASYACRPKCIGPGMVLRIASVAGVRVDDVLSGAFPAPGTCPTCGRSGPT